MTHEQQSKLLGEFYAEKKNILKLKGEDYANEDVLSNFKSAGSNIGISAELQCLSLIATKVARLGNLLSGKTPNNESISDSILDLSNYTDLLYCLVNEQITDDVNKPKTKRWENVAPYYKLPSTGLRPMNEYGLDVYRDVVGNPLQKCSDTADKIEEELRKLENAKKFHDELLNEMVKLSKINDELNNQNPECDCTEIPTEYKPTPEPYEPKVGDVFENINHVKYEIVEIIKSKITLKNEFGLRVYKLLELQDYINTGHLKKIN